MKNVLLIVGMHRLFRIYHQGRETSFKVELQWDLLEHQSSHYWC